MHCIPALRRVQARLLHGAAPDFMAQVLQSALEPSVTQSAMMRTGPFVALESSESKR